MTCAKCGREIEPERARAAIMMGDGRAALDWLCFERMLKPARAAELMRLVRSAALSARSRHVTVPAAIGEPHQEQPG